MQLKNLNSGLNSKRIITYIVMLTIFFSFLWAANPGTAGATNTSGEKTSTLTITFNENGNISTTDLTVSDLQNMTQERKIYSAVNNTNTSKFYATEGVMLTDLLTSANIDIDSIQSMTFVATDDYSRSFTREYLLDTPRYYYPELENNSMEGAIPVEPILALQAMEALEKEQLDFDGMDDRYSLRFFCGQTEFDMITDKNFVKWVSQIEIQGVPVNIPAPALSADTTNNIIGQPVNLSFTDDESWRNAITDITVDGESISGKYTVATGVITIDASVFDSDKDYAIVVKASGYQDASIDQHKGSWPIIFTIDGDAITSYSYTITDLKSMSSTTNIYGTDMCKGVALADLLTDLNITDNSWQVQVNVSDAATYHIDPVTVADMLDPANNYLLTYEINEQPITIDDRNQTTLRIYWGTGIIYKNVSGITVSTNQQTSNAIYTISRPTPNTIYQGGTTADGINTMTVNNGISGRQYFSVQLSPVRAHDGLETVVFVHSRNGAQLDLKTSRADYDTVTDAQASFDVQAGDLVKVYIVDDLSNTVDFNPTILQ